MTPGERFDQDEVLRFGDPWHGLYRNGVIELPNGDVIGKSSTGLDTKDFCEFSDRVEAYAATDLGVAFYDLEPHPSDIEARKPAHQSRKEVECAA